MSRHSKNNTAGSVFTYHERKKLKYGTLKERIGRDSIKDYDICALCLHPVVEPLLCKDGHLFCKECIYGYMLECKKDIARQTQLYEEQQLKLREKEMKEENEKREEELRKFDQMACGIRSEKVEIFKSPLNQEAKSPKEDTTPEKDEMKKLNSFWVPGVQRDAEPTLLKKPSNDVKCPEGNHTIRLKQLTKLNFTENKSSSSSPISSQRYQCPVCCKTFTKGSKTAALKKCGHVMCISCLNKVKSDGTCFVCSSKFKDKDIIKIESGGTGLIGSSGEKVIAKKETPAAWL